MTLTFKNLNDLAPYYLTSLLLKYQPARLLRSNRLLLQVPSVNNVAYGHRLFSYYAPIIWNSLPDNIKKL